MHQFIGFKKRRGNYRALITCTLFYPYYTLFEYCKNEIITNLKKKKKNRDYDELFEGE